LHEARDIGRYVAVHPDIIDGRQCSDNNSIWQRVCKEVPNVIDTSRLTVDVSPQCPHLDHGNTRCQQRPTGTELRLTLSYDATASLLFPTAIQFGPWFQLQVPQTFFTYNYFIMVEPH
jgi:hypothetical protein